MIKYNLKCENNHEFESWFSDSNEFDKLNKKKLLECIYCSSNKIRKSIMAPMVSGRQLKQENGLSLLDKKLSNEKKHLLKIREYIEKNFEFVGDKLSQKVRESIKDEVVTMGQIKPLINLDQQTQERILLEIINLNLSSRDVEEKVRLITSKDTEGSEELLHYKDLFEDKTGSKAEIKKTKNKYKVVLNFMSEDALKNFIKRID